MNREIFTLSTEDMGRLGPAEAVQAFRELLWVEAIALSIAKTFIDVPGRYLRVCCIARPDPAYSR
jgi:hypothetical protein